jgi:hypothetical protein
MSIDLDTVLYACQIAIPGGLISGFLGFLIGRIMENSANKKFSDNKNISSRNSDLLIDDLLIDDLDRKIEDNI